MRVQAVGTALLVLVSAAAWAEAGGHVGVASCDGSNCHGKVDREVSANVWLNEYRIWRSQDYHSRAYRTLLSEQSKEIAAKLGMPGALDEACLNCHTTNVPKAQQAPGSRFQISDGVTCEACHGAAERWIDTHDDKGTTHAQNLRNGMYPTEDPTARARLCLDCHMGSSSRFVSHRLYGAGHPRLSFELENFTANQPPHYAVDDDYRRRKGAIEGVTLWLTGQAQATRRYLDLLQSGYLKAGQWAPEFAFYDCQGCHHGLDPSDVRWRPERRAQGAAPGALRLQDHHARMLEVISEVLAPGETAGLRQQINGLLAAGQSGRDPIANAARGFSAWIDGKAAVWQKAAVSRDQIRQIRRRLVSQAASPGMVDYGTAEQGLLSIVTLTTYLGEDGQLAGAIDELFQALGNDEAFQPGRYQAAAQRLSSRF